MPLFDFECSNCNTVKETFTSSDTQTINCDCGSIMTKLVSGMGAVTLVGPGFYQQGTKVYKKQYNKDET